MNRRESRTDDNGTRLPKTMRVSDESPGLRVRGGSPWTRSQGDYVCGGCGAEDHANGNEAVKKLVDDYTQNHGPAHSRKGGR